jgi:site-specific DNA-methyltransferase (adenine-specific)
VPKILLFAKTFQKGRGTQNVPNGTKNELEVNTFDFTEGWFRNSGLYELNAENQMIFMTWFIEDQKCKVAPKKVREYATQLKEQQDQIQLVVETLNKELDSTGLIEAVKRGEYSTNRLMQVIAKLNDGVKSKAVYGVDSIQGVKSIPDASIDVVITDPPYGVDYVPSRKTDNPSFNDSDSVLGYIDALCGELKRVCQENAHLYFFSGCVNAFELKTILGKHFRVYGNWLTWVKNNHTPCDFSARYASKYEVIWFCKMPKGDERKLNNAVSPDVLEYAVERDKAHDCQKPIELLKYLVNNSSALGETILDPFCGSGSTLLAAKALKRNYIGFEIEKSYEPGFKKRIGEIDALGG